mmetsp:Transcript_57939/g.91732  ORF Transcript_57939/g.91732 Transcript_57939/m.91732 type:complete len:80 (-) Transcript_57939:155-394(-)
MLPSDCASKSFRRVLAADAIADNRGASRMPLLENDQAIHDKSWGMNDDSVGMASEEIAEIRGRSQKPRAAQAHARFANS